MPPSIGRSVVAIGQKHCKTSQDSASETAHCLISPTSPTDHPPTGAIRSRLLVNPNQIVMIEGLPIRDLDLPRRTGHRLIVLVPEPFKIRTMLSADLPRADELRRLAGWNQRATDWQRFLDLSSEGCFVAELDETIVGTVTTISYGREVAWIGMLLVHPDSRGRGVGKSLLTHAIEHLQSKQIASIKLDATPLGEPLYRKLGFKDEWALTRYKGIVSDSDTEPPNEKVCEILKSSADQVSALDAEAFGVRRPELIESLLFHAQVAVAIKGGRGVEACGLLRSGSKTDYLSSVVARTSEAATEIILELGRRSGGRLLFWDIPEPNKAARALAGKLGFIPERPLLRMYLGQNDHPGDVQKYFAIADPSLG